MNYLTRKSRLFMLQALSAVAITLAVPTAQAQDTTTSNIRHGEPSHETKVRNAQVVYVEGNDLVLKLESGRVEHLIVPSDEKFNIDGQEVTVSDLKAGTKLTQTIITTTTPRYVNTVRTLRGRVWHVNAPGSLILTLPDGTNQPYKVPSHAKFTINGQKKTVFDLKKGMKLEATIITDEPQTVVEHSKSTVGLGPATATPPLLGVLLIEKAAPAAQEVEEASSVTAYHVDTLPNTGTNLPLVGLLGIFGIGSAVVLGTIRKLTGVKA